MSVGSKRTVRNKPPGGEQAYDSAVVNFRQKSIPQALRHCRKALQDNPKHGGAHHLMGLLLFNSGDQRQALEHLDRAARILPESENILTARARILAILGRTREALDSYRKALVMAPDSVPVLNQYGEFLRQRGKPREAMALFSQALKIEAGNSETLCGAGSAFNELGMSRKALACFRTALLDAPDNARLHASMGHVHMAMGEREAAADCYRSALKLRPDLVTAHLGLITADAGAPCAEQLATLRGLERRDMPINERVDLHFALAQAGARCGRHDEAFGEYVVANELRNELTGGRFDIETSARETAARIEVFDRAYFERRAGWGARSDRPVFIVGMPRSGTTLFESIVGSHPACHMAGELPLIEEIRLGFEGTGSERVASEALPALWRSLDAEVIAEAARRYLGTIDALAPDAARVVDKMPHNFVNLWLIALMLPDTRIIHCRRHPLDTCVSIFTQVFRKKHAYKNDLRTLGLYYRQYQTLMDHWSRALPLPLLEVRYEDLIADQEGVSRRVLEFCGLDWDPACLDFHERQRTVLTASSLQVSQRLYDTSVGRWKRYEKHLGPLIEVLGTKAG